MKKRKAKPMPHLLISILGGKATSERKTIACRRNAKIPPGPGKNPRGRPKKLQTQAA